MALNALIIALTKHEPYFADIVLFAYSVFSSLSLPLYLDYQ